MGESGSGKSTSLRNFEVGDISVFNVASKPFPFRKQLPKMDGATYKAIMDHLEKPTKKSYAIDDSQYLMSFDSFARAKETGYGKYTDMAVNFYNLARFIAVQTPPDLIVYYLHHSEYENDRVKAKTLGRMLDNQLTFEGLFSIVLLAKTDGNRHFFVTQSDGFTTAKSPMGMFETTEIDNDLKMVDQKIREYWNLGGKTE